MNLKNFYSLVNNKYKILFYFRYTMPKKNPGAQVQCPDCGKTMRYANLYRHKKRKACQKIYCPLCPHQVFQSNEQLTAHQTKKHSTNDNLDGLIGTSGKHLCSVCDKSFTTHYQLAEHNKHTHGKMEHFRNACKITDLDDVPNILEDVASDELLKEELLPVKHFLDPTITNYKHQIVFNFPITEQSTTKLEQYANRVFEELPCAAKVNVSFGYVLKNLSADEEQQYRYFYAHDNNALFEEPHVLFDKPGLSSMIQRLNDIDVHTYAINGRPSTKWRFHMLTNVTFKATLIKDVVLGCRRIEIPEFLTGRRDLLCLLQNYNTREKYTDNLCMFRAIAMHKALKNVDTATTDIYRLGTEDETMCLFELFLKEGGDREKKYFRGVKMTDISILERVAQVNIHIYQLSETSETSTLTGEIVYRSLCLYDDTCHLLQVDKHVCYIKDLDSLFGRYICNLCDVVFNRRSNLIRHMKVCSEKTRDVYPGEVYKLQETIFEKLAEIGIVVAEEDRLFKNFAVFDFETFCNESHLEPTATTEFIGEHIPVSVSICNNFISKEPFFLHNSDPQQLVVDFINYLEKLSDLNGYIQFDKYANVFRALKSFQHELHQKHLSKYIYQIQFFMNII